MGAAAGVAVVAGSVLNASGQYQAGKANEAIAKHNAELGRMRAKDSLIRGKELAKQSKQQFKALQSEQDVAFSTQNIQLGVGIPETIRAQTEMAAELESTTILNNAALEAWGYEQGAQESVLQGGLAAASGKFGAAGTLLSGVGQGISIARGPRPAESPITQPKTPSAPTREITL